MTDGVTIGLIGRMLREMQAEIRTIRDENALMRREIGNKASRDEVLNVLSVLSDRIAACEARMETRFDQTERNLEERLIRIEEKLEK